MDKIYSIILSSIPESIDFDFITIKNETVKHIYLDNISEKIYYSTLKMHKALYLNHQME